MIDPAEEAQAAGRIHRLGQTKDILVRRFAFKDTIDEHITQLHAEIKAGRIAVANGALPAEAVRIIAWGLRPEGKKGAGSKKQKK